jgi:hypothetical protein
MMNRRLTTMERSLYSSLDHMLSPEALSEVLQLSIRSVRRIPLVERFGTSKNHMESIEVNENADAVFPEANVDGQRLVNARQQ